MRSRDLFGWMKALWRRSIVIAAVFALAADLVAAFLKGTVVGSASEAYPITLGVFLAAAALLRLFSRPRASAALGLTVVLFSPLVLQLRPVLASFSSTSSFRCDAWSSDVDRIVAVTFFPFDDAHTALWGLPAAALAWWLVAQPRWRAAAPLLRWAAILAGCAAVLPLVGARHRPTAEAYLATRPVAATLFPAAGAAATTRPGQSEGEYPPIDVGAFQVHRRCTFGLDPKCIVRLGETDAVEVGCVNPALHVVLRRDDVIDLWFVEEEELRYAFRRGARSPLEWAEITRRALFPYTRPPEGWLTSLVIGVAVALYAGIRRSFAKRRARAIDAGLEGVAAGGSIEVPGHAPLRAPEGQDVPDGPVVVLAASARPSEGGDAAPRADNVLIGTKAALLDAARLQMLDWDLHGLAAVALALLVVSPWLRFVLAQP